MASGHNELLETHILGDDTLQFVVQAEECPPLERRFIKHVGIGDGATPLHIVRTHLSGAYLHGTIAGEGRVLLDGRWQTQRPGMTSLAPAHVLHAFRAVSSHRWKYCWVRYMPQSPRSNPKAMAPIMAWFDAAPLAQAVMGLYCEMRGDADAASCELWVELIERYVDRFVAPWRKEPRLVALWSAVEEDLGRDWSLDQFAAIMKTSHEHMRRLCQRSLGRSPMQQLAYLRVQHAAHLLATTSEKIDVIARQVGYQNPFAFSNTFKRMTGVRPSTFRARKASGGVDRPS